MDNDVLIPYITQNAIRAAENNIPCAVSKFLDAVQLSQARALSKKLSGRFVFWGGYEGAERVVMLFVPDYVPEGIETNEIFSQFSDSCPLSAVRIKKDRFSSVTHRDYLGAVMGLGISRETVGDITVREDGCDIIALTQAAKYIAMNLTSAGRASLSVELADISQVKVPDIKFEEISFTVASPRTDAVAGEIFSLPRSAAQRAVETGLVFLNDEQITKPDRHVAPGDKLVLRGRGRAVLGDSFITTKKGRLRISARKSV